MQDYILKGIVLRAIDWKEKDKLLTIFTAEHGVVSAALRGVRQTKSKLKFATQPMCFAEFNLAGSGDVLTCTGASEIESFFAITQDYDKMVYASAMLEMIYLTAYKEPNVDLFVSLVRGLGGLCENVADGGVVFAKYCLDFLKCMGYALNFDTCKACGKVLGGDVCIDLRVGALMCKSHANIDSIIIAKNTYELIKEINSLDYADLSKINLSDINIKDCITPLIFDFNFLFDKRLKSIKV